MPTPSNLINKLKNILKPGKLHLLKAKISDGLDPFCANCQPCNIEKNLIEERRIYEDNHDFADLMRCSECGSVYLRYGIELFDDAWNYWARIDEGERDIIMTMDIADYPKGKIIALIRKKEHVIRKKPSDESTFQSKEDCLKNIEVLPGKSCLLDGPAW